MHFGCIIETFLNLVVTVLSTAYLHDDNCVFAVSVTMTTTDHSLLDVQLNKVNFNGLITQLEKNVLEIISIF